MRRLIGLFAGLLLAAVATTAIPTAFAATDVTGAWSAQMAGPSGDSMQLTFNFKQDGAKVTGTILGPQGNPIDISNGKIDGDKLTFEVSFNGMTINHEGTVAGDEIKMTTKSTQGDFPGGEMTLKRTK